MRKNTRIEFIYKFIGLVFMTTLCVAAGYWALSFFTLSGLWQTVCSLWLGIVILAVFGFTMHLFGSGRREEHDRLQHNTLLDAMARIAQGDFSVFVPTDDLIHTELVDAINEMARDLGNLETMRQDFISNVSHEIQSPLTSIGGFAVLLKKDDLEAEQRVRYAGIIETESKRISSLSDNLLKLSTLDSNSITKSRFRLDKQLSNVILTLEPQWSAKELAVEADLQKCEVAGDEDLLSQVWINLLANAIKFTPDGGTICISVEGNTVKVADSGIGIAKGDLPHIFERFYKVDKSRNRSFGGNGLGLPLAKKIVELHGGKIAAQSDIGAGTVVTVSLP